MAHFVPTRYRSCSKKLVHTPIDRLEHMPQLKNAPISHRQHNGVLYSGASLGFSLRPKSRSNDFSKRARTRCSSGFGYIRLTACGALRVRTG